MFHEGREVVYARRFGVIFWLTWLHIPEDSSLKYSQ